jgi:hypothetical protein
MERILQTRDFSTLEFLPGTASHTRQLVEDVSHLQLTTKTASCEPVTFSIFRAPAYPTSCIFTPHKAVILSEALRGSVANKELYGAESKDPEDAYLTHAARSFSTTEACAFQLK